MSFEALVEDIQRNQWNVYGVEVYENGVLTHAYGDTEQNLHEIYSATKTVLSIAVGMAYDAGIFDLQKSVLCYMPKEKIEKMSKRQRDTFEKISIHRLMTMSVADLPFRAEGESFLDFSLACEIEKPEQAVFNYTNISAYLTGVALTQALGTDLGSFVENRIIKPLGVERYEYARCPEGYFYGASGMKLTVHDYSKVGLLLSQKGVYEGRRLLSEKYVEMATSVLQKNREGGYGYFIWKYRDGFSINGKWGQKCYVLPRQGIIVTFCSHMEEGSDALRESMEKHITQHD